MVRKIQTTALLGLALLASGWALAATPPIRWIEPEMGVEITTYACQDEPTRLCGRITRVPAGGPQTDLRNPDPALRRRPLLGLEVVESFESAGADRWEGGGDFGKRPGRIYLPLNGDTLGDSSNRYQLRIDGSSMTIGIANCHLLACLTRSVWHRVIDDPAR